MSISGMTGFARAEGAHEGARWIWEAKSVNGRGLDLKLRLPPGFDALEQPAREAAAKRFKRGSLQVNLSVARDVAAASVARVDTVYVETLLAAGRSFVEKGVVAPPTWDGLLALRGVLIVDETEMDERARAGLDAVLLTGLTQVFDGLDAARRQEGRMLSATLMGLADQLDSLITAARASAAAAPAALLERIRQRLASLSPDIQIEPQRLAQEAALAASRADVQEELDRLAAHAAELRVLIAKPEPAGRRLDFLGQELTREANTLCSKSSELSLTRIGLDLKTAIDQIKEQAANVE
ncbi:MAG: YicC/YloC family endoribonuclease [Terricaulis silvestris]